SKSVRCPTVLKRILDADEGFKGVMSYSGHETAFLAERGFDNILVAYPIWHEDEIGAVCEVDADVWLMVDSEEHVKKLAEVAGEYGTTLNVCIDLDMSSKFLGIHFGVMRSGVRNVDDALELAAAIDDAPNLELDALMGYEAQIAGLTDRNPANNPGVNAVIRFLKRLSAGEVIDRRECVVQALEDEGYELSVVNGGGTGSVEKTIEDESVTEVTVGSGFYAP
ncbi:MAG: alanine racemase, partial [Halobacteria archaeon]|nr:alanine racemase [Halobacteria archaeon]